MVKWCIARAQCNLIPTISIFGLLNLKIVKKKKEKFLYELFRNELIIVVIVIVNEQNKSLLY
jgi:hypothetical protein